jgi:hypothetical protein
MWASAYVLYFMKKIIDNAHIHRTKRTIWCWGCKHITMIFFSFYTRSRTDWFSLTLRVTAPQAWHKLAHAVSKIAGLIYPCRGPISKRQVDYGHGNRPFIKHSWLAQVRQLQLPTKLDAKLSVTTYWNNQRPTWIHGLVLGLFVVHTRWRGPSEHMEHTKKRCMY